MEFLEWVQVLCGLWAIGSGANVLHGVLKVKLRWNRVVRFLRFSLITSMVGLLPLSRHFAPIQGICMLSIYCAGTAVLAWRKFYLAGLWRPVFAFFIVCVLYLNVVSVSIRVFSFAPALAEASLKSGSLFEMVQILLASVFAVLAVRAVGVCHAPRTQTL